MNRHVKAISGRLSLRPPQRHSLEILDRVTEITPPASGQFQMFCRDGAEHREYQPDFVAEMDDVIYMLEPKKRKDLQDGVVLAKKEAAEKWCRNASAYAAKHGAKPWEYCLIAHDTITENMSMEGLVRASGS